MPELRVQPAAVKCAFCARESHPESCSELWEHVSGRAARGDWGAGSLAEGWQLSSGCNAVFFARVTA